LPEGAGFKYYYLSFVSTLAVLYAVLLSALGLGQAVGADRTLQNLNRYFQVPVWTQTNLYPAIFTVLMAYLAYHLWFKKRAALVVLVIIIVAKAVFDLAGHTNSGWSTISIAVAAFFLTAWWAFKVTPDPEYVRRCLGVAVITIPVVAVYGTMGLYLGRHEYGVRSDAASLIKNAWLVIVGRSTVHFVGRDQLFKYTLIAAAIAVMAYMLFLLFRPHRDPQEFTWDEEEQARKILETYGGDSLSYFNTRKGKSFFFHGEDCFLAYRVVGGMALISADPMGNEELFLELLHEFRAHCLRMGWRLSGVGQSDRTAVLLRHMGLHVFVLGEESLVDVTGFNLQGRAVRKLRQSVNQVERDGISVEFMYNASIPTHLRHELQEISKTWRGDNPETGYAMGLGRLLSISDPDCLLARTTDSGLTGAERRTLASVIAALGGAFMVSDDTARWGPEELLLLGQSLPHASGLPVCTDVWKREAPMYLRTRMLDAAGEYLLALVLNWSDKEADLAIDFGELKLPEGRWHVVEFWTGEYLGELTGAVTVEAVEPHGCALARLTLAEDRPRLIGSTLNMSQGAAELVAFDETDFGVRLAVKSALGGAASLTLSLPGAGEVTARVESVTDAPVEVEVERLTTIVYRLKLDVPEDGATIAVSYGRPD